MHIILYHQECDGGGGGLRAVFFFRRLFSLEVVLAGFRAYFRWAFLLSFLEGGYGFRRTAAGYVGVFLSFLR